MGMPAGWSDFIESLVLLLCLLPLVGIALIVLVSRWGASAVRQTAVVNVLLSGGLSVLMVWQMQTAEPRQTPGPRFQMVSVHRWLAARSPVKPQSQKSTSNRSVARPLRTIGPDIRLAFGVDSLSQWLIMLTSLLIIPAVLLGGKKERKQPALFYSLLLLFQSAATGLFAALDVVLFCFCFELTILPLYLLIGRWGGSQRRPAVRRLVVSHLVGSLFVLLGLMGVVVTYWWMQSDAFGTIPPMTFSIPQLLSEDSSAPGLVMLATTNAVAGSDWNQFGPWLFLFLLAGFLIRPALFPFHAGLPGVVREAPSVARMLLLGIVPLFSLYGCVRFLLPLFPVQCAELGGAISAVAIVGLVFTGLSALAETDAVRRITLATISLLQLALAGLFLPGPLGVTGGVVQMLSVGLSVGLLLLLHEFDHRPGQLGAASENRGQRQPRRRALLLFAMLAVIGAPGLGGFSGATLSLLGIFQQSGRWAIPAMAGLLIVAWSLLRLWPTDLSPRDSVSPNRGAKDLTVCECAAVAPIVVAIIWIGINPQLIGGLA